MLSSAPRLLVMASAIAAGFTIMAATDDANAFSRGGMMRPATGPRPHANPGNVEVVLKVLDGRPVRHSNVEYTVTVTDTQTGLSRARKGLRRR
ncbi:MAG TPA: hypothetical protein VJT13_22070 [Xanthobacteraceae bacterium]|nr:hypothetical protein [Xanthobacteraceae bacterium]